MIAVIRHMLRRGRAATVGWGLALGLLAYFMSTFYDTLAVQREVIENLVSHYPRELMAFFGGATESVFSPQGFLSMEFFSMMVIVLGIYAVLSGSGLLVSDEEAGVLDLLLAHPVSRSRFFLGRLIAAALCMAAVLGTVWVAFIVGVARSRELDLSALELLRPIIDLYVLLFLFQALSVLLSMMLPSRNAAAMVSGLLLVASYFVNVLAEFSETLDRLADFLPMRYYQSGYAIDGLKVGWLLGLAGFGVLFVLLGWLLFVRRDIRVSGEGSWRLSWPQRGNVMLRDEIKTDIGFLKRHDLQPKWWKLGKMLVLAGIIVALIIVWGPRSALIWLATMLVCMGVVHFMYRAKTRKYTVAWADFRVDPGDKRRRFGTLYYPLVASAFALASLVMLLTRGR